MFDLEFRAALAMSTISPYMVDQVIAGWYDEDENVRMTKSGFVVEMVSGEFFYITSRRATDRHYTSASTERFATEPVHLYDRAVNWIFSKDRLNGSKEISKQEANYPGSRLFSDAALDSVGCTNF